MILFAATVFLSAFLLFQIQPIAAKMILPWFGGSSSVWSVCLVFFQAGLLLGYAYVHWLHEKLPPRRQALVHAGLLLLSLATLPVAAHPDGAAGALASPGWSVLAVLTLAVGAPYLLLSTTGPLMQAWYARTFAPARTVVRPYRLYALSNLASMLALLSYPVLIEPWLTIGQQSGLWSLLYAGFVLTCVAAASLAWRRMAPSAHEAPLDWPDAPRPGWRERLLWLGLAATPSILLLALTRHLTQDIAPIPFLWVLPLSIYLLSFILCFDAPRYYVRPLFLAALPLAFLALDFVLDGGGSVPVLIGLTCLSLFVICMVCHGELVRRKPPLRHLTLFYLMLSVGGALGGMLVGLLAPALFVSYFELPIGLFLCAGLTLLVIWADLKKIGRLLVPLGLLGYGAYLAHNALDTVDGYRAVLRNFYGQLRVVETDLPEAGRLRIMRHGRISHGEQFLAPALRALPTAYYCERSGIGRIFRQLSARPALKVGVVGLGAGTLAAYGRAADDFRFYEINAQVLDLARSEFSYLADARARLTHVLGDGRLALEREPARQFDLLVMDAFSGDSIPTHLLTLEALRIYLRHLRPDGLLAVHITNHHLDLQPVMAAAARRLGLTAWVFDLPPDEVRDDALCRHSTWVLLQPGPAAPAAIPAGALELPARPGFQPWTDSFSNLLNILK